MKRKTIIELLDAISYGQAGVFGFCLAKGDFITAIITICISILILFSKYYITFYRKIKP